MNEEFALVRACLDNPEDNTVRLVYADWLDEFGNTERQKARSEWIRMTCSRNTPIRSIRQTGERQWIEENAHRLWPNLTKWMKITDRGWFAGLKLSTGVVEFKIPVTNDPTPITTVVRVHCVRGVCGVSFVTFLRASDVVVDLVKDEPFSKIMFSQIPTTCLNQLPPTSVFRRPFELRKLVGVWDEIRGYDYESHSRYPHGSGSTRVKVFSKDMHQHPRSVALSEIHQSLTRWARNKAGVPHTVATEVVPESFDTLVVPPRIA